MNYKNGVKVNGIKPEMTLAIMMVNTVIPDATITSVIDGKHSRTSLHYVGYAIDVRTRDIKPKMQTEYVRQLKEALTDEYDVILESDHIHIEFQPKG